MRCLGSEFFLHVINYTGGSQLDEIAYDGFGAREVLLVRADRRIGRVDRNGDRESGFLEAQIEPTGAGEQANYLRQRLSRRGTTRTRNSRNRFRRETGLGN